MDLYYPVKYCQNFANVTAPCNLCIYLDQLHAYNQRKHWPLRGKQVCSENTYLLGIIKGFLLVKCMFYFFSGSFLPVFAPSGCSWLGHALRKRRIFSIEASWYSWDHLWRSEKSITLIIFTIRLFLIRAYIKSFYWLWIWCTILTTTSYWAGIN